MKGLLGATNTPSSLRVAAVGTTGSLDAVRAQVSVRELDFSASGCARDYSGPSVLARPCFGVAETAVGVGPLHCAFSGSGGGEDAESGHGDGDDGVGMHVGEAGEAEVRL